jgi:hypothetical protein
MTKTNVIGAKKISMNLESKPIAAQMGMQAAMHRASPTLRGVEPLADVCQSTIPHAHKKAAIAHRTAVFMIVSASCRAAPDRRTRLPRHVQRNANA